MTVALTIWLCVFLCMQVITEDTVLFTAQAYLDAQPDPEQRQAAAQQLAPLIRCPHLSRAWLSAATRAAPEELPLLGPYTYEIGECLAFLQSCPWHQQDFVSMVPSTPASWLRGPRVSSIVMRGQHLTWSLSVDELKRACQEVVESGDRCDVVLPFGRPLLGLKLQLVAGPRVQGDGSFVPTVFVEASNAPSCMYNALMCIFKLPGRRGVARKQQLVVPLLGSQPRGPSNLFDVEAMTGGWDEAAWVSKGLPASGELVIECHVGPAVR
jgi:hypothetical protein